MSEIKINIINTGYVSTRSALITGSDGGRPRSHIFTAISHTIYRIIRTTVVFCIFANRDFNSVDNIMNGILRREFRS